MSATTLTADHVAVVVPALNEALRIRQVVADALAHCPRVIVVDDGSDDDTVERIADLPVTVLRHPRRLGKGAALRSGFAEAGRQGAQAVLTMDGDGQHDAADIPRLIAAANRHPGAVIVGARLRKRASQPFIRRIGNDFGDWGIAWGCGFRLVDSQSGQRLYPKAVFELQDVAGEGFVFEAQMLISAARRTGARVVAVPIETRYMHLEAPGTFRKSHFRLVRDLWKITSHVVAQVWAYGHVIREYRRTRAHPPLIDDPSGEFDTVSTSPRNHAAP
ncbi:glycosyltransferase family 2 protein [Pseudoxanthomonas composti]|uniref:Glycosyltransferase family 2 protein n=1 Tax=Pseudoxanthomonas composti TaxID=2137479 RepID=A0A4Q1JWH0_9GAMM|nr:glycosyltransferase family 2 protein [Pseudoxanthomonas composti]RXR06515.1 glycosyltransferase family 2 protein [Pseudoxanthomonas composti]